MFALVLLSSAIGTTRAGQGGKCRGLVLAGGGDKGAYQAGVISGLVSALPAGEAQYDVVTGVGCGALNAALFASYDVGSETTAADAITSFWESSTSSDFYQDWPGGVVEGILSKSGFYDSSPLNTTVLKLVPSNPQGRSLVVGATDLVTGDYVTFNSTMALSDLQTGIVGSFSMAGVFPVTEIENEMLMDGSVKYKADILSAVTTCQLAGYKNANIIVDIAMVAGKTMTPVNAANYKTLQVLIRYLEIQSYNGVMQVVENAAHDYPGVTIRYVISPSATLPNQLDPWPYDFSSSDLKSMVQLGISDATKAVSASLAYY